MKLLQTIGLGTIVVLQLLCVSLCAAPTIDVMDSSSDDGPSTIGTADDKIGTNGNWVKKKDFLMRSFDVLKDIESLATQIQGYHPIYQQKFNDIDTRIDQFYKKIGLEQGNVGELFDQINAYIKQKKERRLKRATENIVDIREQQLTVENLEESLKVEQEELNQLKSDMKSIEDLDKSVNIRLQKADEQITRAQQEAVRSREIVQSMWAMIDDKRAKAAYFEVKDGILVRLQAIDRYLNQDLIGDLEKVLNTISTQIAKATDAIKQIESKGYVIQDRSKKLEEMRIKKEQEVIAAALAAAQKAELAAKAKKKRKTVGFFDQVYQSLVNTIASTYNGVTSLFTSKPAIKIRARKAAARTEQAPVEQPKEAAVVQHNNDGSKVAPVQNNATQASGPLTSRQSFAKPIIATQPVVPPLPPLSQMPSAMPQS